MSDLHFIFSIYIAQSNIIAVVDLCMDKDGIFHEPHSSKLYLSSNYVSLFFI